MTDELGPPIESATTRCGWCDQPSIVTASGDVQGRWHGGLFDQGACLDHVDDLFADLGEWARACQRDIARYAAGPPSESRCRRCVHPITDHGYSGCTRCSCPERA